MSDLPTGPISDSALDASSTVTEIGASQPADVVHPRPERIGPYKILELIGEGGMGEVYKAERSHPIRQTVAIKVIKLGYGSREVVGRFESERQALAMMNHPGIAKVFDAGTSDSGRPYFVMEYVAGNPITDFCDDNRLSIADRLELFMEVCDAIAHAHSKAIIHRDIKPSNVLAYMHDGKPAAKVIDFGIAKATSGDRLSQQTYYTAMGQTIGTYDSMSPEQADGSPDIDTRTDVYSLGVLLYELLTGARPFDRTTLAEAADAEIKRIIREVEPPKPSTRLSELGADASALAERRQADLPALSKQLRHELEWIPLKAMRKDRARRYASSLQLKEDVQNYLDGNPLIAGPETRSYRLQKFVKRNRAGVVTSVTMLLLIIAGISVYIRNIRNEQHKTQLALIEAQHQKDEAQKQSAVASATSGFLSDMLSTADPNNLLGDKVTVVQAIEAAIKELDAGAVKNQPEVESALRVTIGKTLLMLGRFDQALSNYQRALEIDRATSPADDSKIADQINSIGAVQQALGNRAEAEQMFRRSLDMRRKQVPRDPTELASSLNNLGNLLSDNGKLDEAEKLLREAVQIDRSRNGPKSVEAFKAINNLSIVMMRKGDLAEAEKLMRQVLDLRRAALPPGHPDIAATLGNLANIYTSQQKLDLAIPLLREQLEMDRKYLPANHPDLALVLNNLGSCLLLQQKYAEAEAPVREGLAIRRASLPANHRDIGLSAGTLALILADLGRVEEAAPFYRECMMVRKVALPHGDPATINAIHNYAWALGMIGRKDESADAYREEMTLRREMLPADHPDVLLAIHNYGCALRDAGKFSEAEAQLREALAKRVAKFGHDSEFATQTATSLAKCLELEKKPDEATALRKEFKVAPATQPSTN